MNGAHPTPPNPNLKNLHQFSISIFITNFPVSVTSKDLWKLCDRHGVVAHVYIARKLSKSGRRFGFVRFIKNPNQVTLLEELNKIWIGSYHLFASVARLDRNQNLQMKQPTQKQSNPIKPLDASHSIHSMEGRSFMSVLKGKDESQKTTSSGPISKHITLENSDLLELSDTTSTVLAKVRDVHLIMNIYSVLKKEGFSDFKCKYMGGLWLWIEFNCDESSSKFQKNKELERHFTQRIFVSHNFIPDERMIWIEIEGLPLKAWTVNAFKKIASIWGETVFLDEDAVDNIASGRVCIKTRIKTHILDSCLVSIKGVSYQVKVREFANWVPDIVSSENISQHDYDSGDSDNEHDIHDNNELQKGEGEIKDKEEPFSHQMNGLPVDDVSCDSETSNDDSKDSGSSSDLLATSRLVREVDVHGVESDHVDSIEEGEIRSVSVLYNDGCVKNCMEKKLEEEVGTDIQDCYKNVNEKCEVVNNNNNMSKEEGEILGDHFESAPAKDPNIVSPSTPTCNDLNLADESDYTWLDYVGPLISGEMDSEKRWSYRDPKGNVHGLFLFCAITFVERLFS